MSAIQINKVTQNAVQLAETEQGRQLTPQEISEIRNSVADEVLGAREELESLHKDTNISETPSNIDKIPQNNVQNVSNLQNTIQSDTERFSQEVEEWKNNNWNNKKHLTVLQNTPQLYLDMGLNDLPITVTANKLDRIFNAEGNQKSTYHNLQDLVKELPRAISNPLNIVESSTRDGGIVVVTDLSDSNNDIVVVSLAPDGQGRLEVDDVITTKSANVMTSAYGRRNYDYNVDNQGNYYDGWMEENLKNNRIIYDIDEGIIKKRINGQWLELPNDTDSSNTSVKRLQLPSDTGISDVSSTTNTSINNIIRPGQNYVNNSQENFAFPTNEQLQAMDNKKITESADTLSLKKVNQNFYTENKSTNLDKSTSKSYKDIKLNETRNIPTNDILELLKDEGGYRKQEYVSELKESIKKDGIKTPIEISIGPDGQYQIDNGKHRLQIAKELGIDKVPVKLVESWSDIVSRKVNKGAEGNDGATNNNNVFNEESRSSSRMSRNGNEILEDGRTATRNVEFFDGESDSIKQRSSVQASGNNIENSEKGSFLMPTNINNVSLDDEMFEFYQQMSNNSNYSTTFKQRIGEMLEKAKSRTQFEKIKETVANYKTDLSSSEVDKRTSEVRKYIDNQNSVISTKGLKMKNSDIINTIVDNVGMSKKYNYKTLNKIAGEISNLLYNGELTDTKIEQIVGNLGENIQTTIDEYYEANKELKKTIQNTKVYVSEDVKNGFGEWNDFRKRAMGSMRLTNDSNALPIDTFYMELSDTYGDDMFPSNIVNASDQLQRIVEVSKQIKKTDMNFEKYVEQTYGKDAWNETARQLADTIKGIRTKLGQNGMYVKVPDSKGGIRERNWTKTAKDNDLVKNFLDVKDLKYEVKTNSSTVKTANATLDNLGYDEAYKNFASNMKAGRRMTVNDIALGIISYQNVVRNYNLIPFLPVLILIISYQNVVRNYNITQVSYAVTSNNIQQMHLHFINIFLVLSFTRFRYSKIKNVATLLKNQN